MTKFLNSMEKKFGKYAIKRLPYIMILIYAVGYIMFKLNPAVIYNLSLDPYAVIHGHEYWRLVTWILVPPEDDNLFFVLIMLYFYYSIATTLELTWGSFYLNLYVFSGLIWTMIGAFGLYIYLENTVFNQPLANLIYDKAATYRAFSLGISTYYMNISILLAYAATYANETILLFFVLPIKMGVLGVIYFIYFGVMIYDSWPIGGFIIGAALVNFLVFFVCTRGIRKVRRKLTMADILRQRMAKAQARNFGGSTGGNSGSTGSSQSSRPQMKYKSSAIAKHKCAICGRTSESNPELSFRFCSKCEGNFEYCEEHIFTHKHVTRE